MTSFLSRPARDTVGSGGLIAAASGLASAAGLLAYSLAVEPYRLELTHPEVPVPRLPAVLDGLAVLLLTDPHTSGWGRREEGLLKALCGTEPPDLIVWGGDFIQGSVGVPHALRLVREVGCLFPGCPSYGVLGNAEHKLRPGSRKVFGAKLRAAGVRLLDNESEPLTVRGETITVAGVDDPYYGWAFLDDALAGAPPPSERFTLLLSHSPQLHLLAARAGVDLMVSGHTHGGQVRLPLIGPLKTQNPLARRMDCGLFDREKVAGLIGRDPGGDLVTYISRGIGVAPLPKVRELTPRFLCRPEAARLVLRRAFPVL